MSYTYAQRKKAPGATAIAPRESAAQTRMAALESGAIKPGAAELGHRVDLPEAMRARMEAAFGADLSAVRLYESEAVADAGAKAVTQGSNIAFAPGKLDFVSSGGRALLGHELSHVVTQQRGEVTGGGFLNDRALEARADREGAMAARGESVYGGAAAPLSAASAAPAAGPMQAMKDKKMNDKEKAELDRLEEQREEFKGTDNYDQEQEDRYNELNHKAMDEVYRGAKWGLGKRMKNWFSNWKRTGLSNRRKNIQARMNAEMNSLVSLDDEDEEKLPPNPVPDGGAPSQNANVTGSMKARMNSEPVKQNSKEENDTLLEMLRRDNAALEQQQKEEGLDFDAFNQIDLQQFMNDLPQDGSQQEAFVKKLQAVLKGGGGKQPPADAPIGAPQSAPEAAPMDVQRQIAPEPQGGNTIVRSRRKRKHRNMLRKKKQKRKAEA